MILAIVFLVTLMAAPAARAQSGGHTGPLTDYEAGLMSDVWSEIRRVENFEDIDWQAVGYYAR